MPAGRRGNAGASTSSSRRSAISGPYGHPARFVHIAGTNGKGSVAHYLEQGLRFAGSTGSWTGPHVFDYGERFHVEDAQPAVAICHQQVAVP